MGSAGFSEQGSDSKGLKTMKVIQRQLGSDWEWPLALLQGRVGDLLTRSCVDLLASYNRNPREKGEGERG